MGVNGCWSRRESRAIVKMPKETTRRRKSTQAFPSSNLWPVSLAKWHRSKQGHLGTIVSCSMKQRDEKSQLTFNPPSRNLSNYPFNMHKCITAHSSITENLQDWNRWWTHECWKADDFKSNREVVGQSVCRGTLVVSHRVRGSQA